MRALEGTYPSRAFFIIIKYIWKINLGQVINKNNWRQIWENY